MALTWRVAGTSDPGLKRRRNEDSLLLDEPNGIVIAADGIGGRAAGDVASAEAARAVQESLAPVESASGSARAGAGPSRKNGRGGPQG